MKVGIFTNNDFSKTNGVTTTLRAVLQMPGDVAARVYTADDTGADEPDHLALAHPNPREPFGIAPLEAMASRLPLVAPRAGGVLTYADDGNAWLAEPVPGAMAVALSAALTRGAGAPAGRDVRLATGVPRDLSRLRREPRRSPEICGRVGVSRVA